MNEHFEGAFRAGKASGSISDGTFDFGGTTPDASLDDVNHGDIEVSRSSPGKPL
ncbi:MAG: hypothetical protein IRY97_03880 [Thermomicrobiaceae bacterium]|nr:hypothetical protein [Thermomicrobiaceae bacterium]